MSESFVIKTFILTIIIYGILVGTVFYEEPRCISTNVDLLDSGYYLPVFISGAIALVIMYIYGELCDLIKKLEEK